MSEFMRFLAKACLRKVHLQAGPLTPPLAVFNCDVIGRHVVCDGLYERDNLAALARDVFPWLPTRELCIDIGANIGNHSVFFAGHFGRVIAFEPNLRAFKLLEANAMLCGNISAVNLGLSDRSGPVGATYNPGNVGMASIGPDRESRFSVTFELARLDDLLTDADRARVSFVKIDVEGHELQALTGARKTLEASFPVVALEVLEPELRNGSTAAIDYLLGLGYRHLGELAETAPFRDVSMRVAKMWNAVNVVFRDRRTTGTLALRRIEPGQVRGPHGMLLVSRDPLPI